MATPLARILMTQTLPNLPVVSSFFGDSRADAKWVRGTKTFLLEAVNNRLALARALLHGAFSFYFIATPYLYGLH
jgi:hypothetical protein